GGGIGRREREAGGPGRPPSEPRRRLRPAAVTFPGPTLIPSAPVRRPGRRTLLALGIGAVAVGAAALVVVLVSRGGASHRPPPVARRPPPPAPAPGPVRLANVRGGGSLGGGLPGGRVAPRPPRPAPPPGAGRRRPNPPHGGPHARTAPGALPTPPRPPP